MMKKLISVLLTIALLMGLAVSALAYEDTDPPKWEEWGYDSLEELLEYMGWTEEEYYEYIAYNVALQNEYPAWREAYLAEHPDFPETVIAEDAKNPYWQRFYWYESKEDFEEYNLSEGQTYEDYIIEVKLTGLFRTEWNAKRRIRERVAMGGPEEGVGVMWNGEYITFPDARPVIKNSRTMVPIRAFMEQVGAEVDYEKRDGVETVILTLEDGSSISFVPGEVTAELKTAEGTKTIEMDSAPYIDSKTNRTYVPLRFFTEALGYAVGWDSAYETAIVIDTAALKDEIDRDFTVINGAISSLSAKREGALKAELNAEGSLKLFDSLNGDRTAAASASITALTDGKNLDVSAKWDAEDLFDAIVTLLDSYDYYSYYYYSDTIEDYRPLMKSGLGLIFNADDGIVYIGGELVGTYAEYIDALKQSKSDGEVWLGNSVDMDYLGTLLPDDISPELTVGNLFLAYYGSNYGSVYSYSNLLKAADSLKAAIGDGAFSDIKGGKKAVIDLGSIYEDTGSSKGDISITVLDSGEVKLSLNASSSQSKISYEVSITKNAVSAKLYAHQRNVCEVTVTITGTVSETTERPRTAPPIGSNVITPVTSDPIPGSDNPIPVPTDPTIDDK